ncbi:hypothetical protein FACHB389_36355 [Nostoc calcicola FACHB-389]|nr:LOG family protein [Nostoc calcicola FACHB-3891]OKH12710.1 hypothetical protein FACHB389_36355 [Nostoc calcicola FACHB-389]
MEKPKYATTFGGSELDYSTQEYQDAIKLGEFLATKGYVVKCGGYYGLMEAVAKGVSNKNGMCIGVTNASFDPKKPNQYISQEIKCNDLFDRLRELTKNTELFIVQYGSFGTLTELFIVWCLAYTYTIKDIEICLIGSEWNIFIESLHLFPIKTQEFQLIKIFNTLADFIIFAKNK